MRCVSEIKKQEEKYYLKICLQTSAKYDYSVISCNA